jgi:hypothetical protein
MFMKKNIILFGILALLLACALPAVAQELRLELEQGALEKLSAMEETLYIEWGVYRNT